jgi:uncharacterized protein
VDTGALLALLDEKDIYHKWAKTEFQKLREPLVTCEAVVTETAYLMRNLPNSWQCVVDLWARKWLRVDFDLQREWAPVHELRRRYATVPMDWADACLVRMTELHSPCRVWTVDSDFKIYRRNKRQVIPLIHPA